MLSVLKRTNPFLVLLILAYGFLAIISWDNCYFWDTVQQVSKEGHWFYLTGFSSLLIPADNALNISATGYHPPLMGIMTALLWKIFGMHIWVSHAFAAFWAVLLMYNCWKLITFLFPRRYAGWAILILLLEPTVLTQFAIASPDFILFTAFVISLRGILERKPVLLGIGMFLLCCMNMRGVFVGIMLFLAHLYFDYLHSDKRISLKSLGKTLAPYLPTFFVLGTYFIYYFSQKGWFFANADPTGHYSMPQNIETIAAHFFSFVLRSVEYGRIAVWFLAFFFVFILIRKKERLSSSEKMLMLFVLLMNGLYFLFVFISQMPFGSRYFMPQFSVLTLLVLLFLVKHFDAKRMKTAFVVVLFFTLSGHLWIYPERMAQPWDATLAHLPYYELRKDCFDYIDQNDFDYADISAGFCLSNDRGFTELAHRGKVISDVDMNKRYFIYSNISNLEDRHIDELKNPVKWSPVKSFNKGFVSICIYQNRLIDKERQK